MKRRSFLHNLIGSSVGAAVINSITRMPKPKSGPGGPVVLSTWDFGMKANEEAWKILSSRGRTIDAVEQGVRVTEADPNNSSVGLGGLPDRDGHVTLDACVMDETGNAGSVCFLEHILHPVSVARKVMEDTPHVILSGEGALQFALEKGFEKTDLLTPQARKSWEEWKKKAEYKPIINIENHDTIGMVALDAHGNLSGACTTSGLAYKMHGRVGDSPIIGAALFVDNEVGAATATGHGEEVIRTVGTHLVVELMRQGKKPEQACREAVERIVEITKKRGKNLRDIQVGFIAINKNGEYGAYCIQDGFSFAVYDEKGNRMQKSDFVFV